MRVAEPSPIERAPPTPVSSASRLPPGVGGEVVEQRERSTAFDHTQRRDLTEACCDLGELAGRAVDSIGDRAQRPGEVGVLRLRRPARPREGSSDRGSRTARLVGARAPPAARTTPASSRPSSPTRSSLQSRTSITPDTPSVGLDRDREDRPRDVSRRLGGLPVEPRIALDIVDGDRLPRGNGVPRDAALHGESHADHRSSLRYRSPPRRRARRIQGRTPRSSMPARQRPPARLRRWPRGRRRDRSARGPRRGRSPSGPALGGRRAAWSRAQHRITASRLTANGTSTTRPSGGRGGATPCRERG